MSIDTAIETNGHAAPAWRKAKFPDGFSTVGRGRAAEDLFFHIADRDRVEQAINTVIGTGYWIDRDQFDKIQQILFGEPEAHTDRNAEPQARTAAPEEKDAATEAFVAELARAKEINERLRGEVNKLTVELTNVQKEIDRFKTKVVRVASEYATEHDWCAVVDEALDELGLKREPQTYRAMLTIAVRFTGTLAERRPTPDGSWVRDSLTGRGDIEAFIEGHLDLDRDHEGIAINDIEWEITDVVDDE